MYSPNRRGAEPPLCLSYESGFHLLYELIKKHGCQLRVQSGFELERQVEVDGRTPFWAVCRAGAEPPRRHQVVEKFTVPAVRFYLES